MVNNVLNKKKCMFVIPRMGNGGAERVLATLANELSKENYEVLIVSLTSDDSFYKLQDDVKIIGAGYKVSKNNKLIRTINLLVNGVKSLSYLSRTIKSWEPDIVVSFLTHTNILSLIIKLFRSDIKLVVSERCEPRVRNFPTKITTKYLYTLADVIICQSEVVAGFFPNFAQNKIKVIQNPVNIESISNKYIEKRRKAIIGVGRLFEQKNFALLIDSFSDINTEFPEHILEIYGEGHLRGQLQHQIARLGLENKVYLMGVRDNVMKHVSDAELFVMSSNFEGFPNALIEAMASGMPVISTDFSTGVARELIKEENGIVVPVGDRTSMTMAIRKILSNSDYQKNMSKENRKIKNSLSTEKILNKWIDVFGEVIL